MMMLFFLAAAASDQSGDLYKAYEGCVRGQVASLVSAGETAEMTADAAISACEVERLRAHSYVYANSKSSGTAAYVLQMFDKNTRDAAVVQTMRLRSKRARH
jgi:hypothetical protein